MDQERQQRGRALMIHRGAVADCGSSDDPSDQPDGWNCACNITSAQFLTASR